MKNLKTTMAPKILQHISIRHTEFSCGGVIKICDKPSCECHHYAQLRLLIFSNPNIEKFVKPERQEKNLFNVLIKQTVLEIYDMTFIHMLRIQVNVMISD
jgi:hypothetical protein